jgi:hypothetical protein
MAEILKFPDKFHGKRLYRIPLYSEQDIHIVLFAINAFGDTDKRVIVTDLVKMDPIVVIKSIDFAIESGYISNDAKEHLTYIIKSIEEISPNYEN